DEPLAYWNFDETDGNAIQQAPLIGRPVEAENNLLPVNGAGRASHAASQGGLTKLGNAADLSGTNFFQAAALRPGKEILEGAYAIEFWMQAQGENDNEREDYLMNIGGNSPAMLYDYKPDEIEMYAGASRTDAGPTVSDSEWHHVVFVYYGDALDGVADRVDAYIDGQNSQYIGNLYSKRMNLSQILVGAAEANGTGGFEGRVDELAIYDLSDLPDEISVNEKMNALVASHLDKARNGAETYSSVVIADKPLLYWNFDEESGPAEQLMPITLPDLDNTKNELAPFYDAQRVSHADVQSGLQLGNSADLSGAGGFYGKTDGLDLGVKSIPGPWAVELWFQLKADQQNRYILNMGQTPNSPAIIYGYFGPTLEVFGASGGRSTTNGVPVTDRNWHHMLVVNYNTMPGTTAPGPEVNRVDMYLDNVLYTNIGGGFNRSLDLSGILLFGSAVENPDPSASGSVNARLDELALYDLSNLGGAEEVNAKVKGMAASHYAAGFGGTSAGTITFNGQPASATATIGQTVEFHSDATVSGTSLPLTYQWQRNGVSIEGATNSNYSLPVTINEIGTNTFRLRAAAGPVTKFSDAAVLIVEMPPIPPATAYSAQIIAENPLFYWNFDELIGDARQVAPLSRPPVATENDLVPVGNPVRMSHTDLGSGLDKLGNALVLDGASFMMASDARLSRSVIDNAYAIELWIQMNGGTNEYLANFGAPGSDNSPALIHNFIQPGYLELYGGAGGRTTTNGPALADFSWHHLVWVNYNNAPSGTSNRVDVYFDGVLSTNVGGGFNRNLDLRAYRIGAALTGGENAFNGSLDEFAVYDLDGLTDSDVAAKAALIATNHFAAATSSTGGSYSSVVLADHPILYYNFEESDGNAVQQAPVTLPLINNDANTLVNAGARRVQHAAINSGLALGNAADLDGTSYFQAAATDPAKVTIQGPWAVEFWMQVQGENNGERQDYLMSFANEGTSFLYDFKPDQLEIYAGVRTDNGPTISDNEWHHVLWVYYGNGTSGVADRADAYVDGVPFTYIRNDFDRALPLRGSTVIGAARPGYNAFQGRIDEVAVYDLGNLADEAAVEAKAAQLAESHIALARAAAAPALSINLSGNELVINWSATGYVLQSSTDLATPNSWTGVQNGGVAPVRVPVNAASAQFFRLTKP
ncbi:MAG: LamG-like jellyroll fold domain-containing protein, partial [Verrucomicrobiota bacterium]